MGRSGKNRLSQVLARKCAATKTVWIMSVEWLSILPFSPFVPGHKSQFDTQAPALLSPFLFPYVRGIEINLVILFIRLGTWAERCVGRELDGCSTGLEFTLEQQWSIHRGKCIGIHQTSINKVNIPINWLDLWVVFLRIRAYIFDSVIWAADRKSTI